MPMTKAEIETPAPTKSPQVPDARELAQTRPRRAEPARTVPSFRSALLPVSSSASIRAQETGTLQRSVGNARINRMIQRACACGGEAGADGECAACKAKRMSAEKDMVGSDRDSGVPATVQRALDSGGGSPLSGHARASMEGAFGTDLAHVRVHTGPTAARAAKDINASAFTSGRDIYFGEGRYQPDTREGQRLLAHEVTHTIQQGRGRDHVSASSLSVSSPTDPQEKEAEHVAQAVSASGVASPVSAHGAPALQRDVTDIAEEFVKDQLQDLGNRPLGPASGYKNPKCPPNFCQPFANLQQAAFDLVWARPLILAGIAKKVNSRVVPLWRTYLGGGAAPQDLTSSFGADFTVSDTTASTTTFLLDELKKDVETNHATLLGSLSSVTIDFTPRLSAALTAIDTTGSGHAMDFNKIGDIAGNIAGGIGKDQTSFKIGATPSPFNDDRTARITAVLFRSGSHILVVPSITFKVHDTIDLCPGNCGEAVEQIATIPLSRFEATGFAGDVPFTVDFPAPPMMMMPFYVTPKAPPPPPPATPVTGEVTASQLWIRAAPSTAAAKRGAYPRGTVITLECETTGTPVEGDPAWNRTDKGFVSSRYIKRLGPNAPPGC